MNLYMNSTLVKYPKNINQVIVTWILWENLHNQKYH